MRFRFHDRRFHRDPGAFDAHRGRPDHGPRDDRRGHGPGGGWGRGGPSELRRFFAHGDLRLVILHLIAEKPRHGYEIIKAVEDRVGGTYSPSPGVVYPTLTLLEELGHVRVTPGEGTKKLHDITSDGQAFLDANRSTLDVLLARMAQAAEIHGEGLHPSIVRAREGLKLALRMRFARGPLTGEQSAVIAAALEAAANTIERS